MRKLCALLLLFSFYISSPVSANPRCECEYTGWIGDCKANIELKGNWFKVISNTQQCSRVDWYIDEQPQVTIVTDGADMEEWLGTSKSPQIVIQSCKICRDTNSPSNNKNKATSSGSDSDNGGLTGTLIFEQPKRWSGSALDTEIILDGKSVITGLTNGRQIEVDVGAGNHDLQCIIIYRSDGAQKMSGRSTVQVAGGDTIKFVIKRPWTGNCGFIRK